MPSGLSSLKSKVDKLNIGKLETAAIDLSKLSDVVKDEVAKKTWYNIKIKDIEDKIPDITNLATNAALNAKINEVKGTIPSITNLTSNTVLNAKINEGKDKTSSMTNLATTTALTTVENKMPNVSNLVKETNYNTAIKENYWSWNVIS